MTVSVIIPTYNASSTIVAQLQSLLRQLDGDGEVVVSDNGSTDATAAVVRACASSDPRVHLVDSSDAQGPAHARNVGTRASSGDLLLFCDADDEAGEHWIGDMTARLATEQAVSGALHKFRVVSGSRVEADVMHEPPNFYGIPWPVSANLAMRRSALELIGGFDESLQSGEDIDLGIRLNQAGVSLAFEPSVMHYRMRSSSAAERRQLSVYSRWQVILEQRYRQVLSECGITVPGMAHAVRDLAGHIRRTPAVLKQHGAEDWWTWTRMRLAKIHGHLDWAVHHDRYAMPRPGLHHD